MQNPVVTNRVKVVEWGFFHDEWEDGYGFHAEPYFELKFRTSYPFEDDQEEPEDPVEIRLRLAMNEMMRGKLLAVLRMLGYEDESFDRLDPDHADPFDFSGKELSIVIQPVSHEAEVGLGSCQGSVPPITDEPGQDVAAQ